MSRPTDTEIASSFDLWQDYIDPNATTSRAQFDAMSHADRMALIVGTFGPDPERVPTVDEILEARTRTFPMGKVLITSTPGTGGACRITADTTITP
jgi:hypothetical protein